MLYIMRVCVWWITEPVMAQSDHHDDADDDDDECHQMVMAWTLDDWKVNIYR